MKIICEREKLLSVFQTAASVAPSRSPKPVLQNVRLDSNEKETILMATDTEVGIRIVVSGVEVEKGGSVLLPVARFRAILQESSDEKINLETDTHGTIVRGDRSEFKLPAENPDEFPLVAAFAEQKFHEVPSRLLRELIRRTLFATDNESSRYALGGVLLEMEENKISAVGTDGRRLAKMEGTAQSFEGHLTGESTTIVPSRAMQLVERAFSDDDSEIQISARGNDVLFRSPRITINARLVEGRFPKWRDVFPERRDAAQIEMSVGPFLSALRQAAIVTSQESRGVSFTFGDGLLVLAGSTAEIGQSRVEVPIAYDGASITITLNHQYVEAFLKVLDAEKTFQLEIQDAESAAVCTTDDGYGYVIMPLAKDQ